jgi:hypothetical protein
MQVTAAVLTAELVKALAEDFAEMLAAAARPRAGGADLAAARGGLPGQASAMLPARRRGARPGVEDGAGGAALPAIPIRVPDDLAADLRRDLPHRAYGASPSESYWLDDDHLACQAPMFELRERYAGRGLGVPDWRKRPDDHLVFQLQFLAPACGGQANAGRLARLAVAGFRICCAGCRISRGVLPPVAKRPSMPRWRC